MSTRTLDYGSNSPFSGVLGRPRNLAWPVHAYRVTIPATIGAGRELLNPFERVVLNVIDAVGGLDEKALADETCIPVDLVRNVTLRLRDKGLINQDNLIIDRQRRKWGPDARDDTYTSALAFRELAGGRLLPFVHVLDDANPIKTKVIERFIWTLTPDQDARRLGPPSTRDVIDVITQMRKRSEAHAQVARIPTIEQVRVEREPEEYLLDCSIAIQSHDAEYRIADPFGTGFSRGLEEVLANRLESDERLQEWMTKWYQNLSTPKYLDDHQPTFGWAFATEENRGRYPHLIRALTPARGSQQRTVEDIYASLEWALFYACETYGPDLAVQRLRQEVGPNYSKWLSGITKVIGFERPESGFRPIPDGKFRDYTDQKPELETVLAIALLEAEVDPEHPLRTVASTHPEFIVRIRTLASDRGDRAHGTYVTLANESQLASDPFMRETISTLLPAVQFDSEPTTPDAASQADLRLDARNSLRDAFDYQGFNKLGPSAKASLIQAEQFWIVSKDGDDARAFISSLYSALQGVLRGLLTGAAPIGLAESQYKSQADANANQTGLGPLPEELASVNPRRIRETLRGNDLSVGASAIALLLTAGEETLNKLAASQPDFLAVIADIHVKRGHGNLPMPLAKRDAGQFRSRTITTLVTLLDLTQED